VETNPNIKKTNNKVVNHTKEVKTKVETRTGTTTSPKGDKKEVNHTLTTTSPKEDIKEVNRILTITSPIKTEENHTRVETRTSIRIKTSKSETDLNK